MVTSVGVYRHIVRVGVAVMTKVRAGVVFADVFRHDAAAGGTLAFVLAVIAEFPMVRTAEERIA